MDNKVWLNSKYIKTKQNCKLIAKFFYLFWVLYLVSKQAYMLELLKKSRIYNVFHISQIEQNRIKNEKVDESTIQLDF